MKNKSENIKTNNLIKTLFALIITTAMILTLSLSRFQKQITVEEEQISVAVFSLSPKEQPNMEYYLESENNVKVYELYVSNSENNKISEVSMKYDIIMTTPKELIGLEFDIDGIKPEISADGLMYTFKDIGTFDAGVEATNYHQLTIFANYDNTIVNEYLGINIEVYGEQID